MVTASTSVVRLTGRDASRSIVPSPSSPARPPHDTRTVHKLSMRTVNGCT